MVLFHAPFESSMGVLPYCRLTSNLPFPSVVASPSWRKRATEPISAANSSNSPWVSSGCRSKKQLS